LVLSALGYTSISFNTEVASITESVLEELKMRFKDIVVFYDNDKTGLKNRFTEIYYMLNKINIERTLEAIVEFINWYNTQTK